jgi:hypothetical protein
MTTIMHDPAEKMGAPYKHIFIATTCYEKPSAEYTFALSKTRLALRDRGIISDYYLLHGNCHVDDARNQAVADFLASDADHLLFIDADVSWEPKQIERLLAPELPVVGGVYPLRGVGQKANAPVVTLDGAEPDSRGVLEVAGLPTGFLLIHRQVFDILKMAEPENGYFKTELDEQWMHLFFERTLEDGKRYGGDLSFCRKWREIGGSCYADVEMRLGHAGSQIYRGSLGTALRRKGGSTLAWICHQMRFSAPTLDMLTEARQYVDNHWGAPETLLAVACKHARQVPEDGAILEMGSGLSTVLMAASNPNAMVWCVEHDPLHAEQTKRLIVEAGLRNVMLIRTTLKDDFYEITDADLAAFPSYFDMALVDGPPRTAGDRNKFFDVFGDMVGTIICDDADDPGYDAGLITWAEVNSYSTHKVVGDRILVLEPITQLGATA